CLRGGALEGTRRSFRAGQYAAARPTPACPTVHAIDWQISFGAIGRTSRLAPVCARHWRRFGGDVSLSAFLRLRTARSPSTKLRSAPMLGTLTGCADLRLAADLYRGPFLADTATGSEKFEDWSRSERTRLHGGHRRRHGEALAHGSSRS